MSTRRDAADSKDAGVAQAPLHIAHIISGLGQGGAEAVLYRLTTAQGQAHRHTVISLGDTGIYGARLRDQGIAVHALEMRGLWNTLKGPGKLWRLLRRLRPDVVQTWMYHADVLGGVAARLAGIRAVAWGIRNSGADLGKASRSARWLAWAGARLSGLVPAVIIVCAENALVRHRAWGYRADRMRLIGNGYDLERWRPDFQAGMRIRQEIGVDAGAPLIGCVARWNPLKDHGNLLAALAILAKNGHVTLRCVLIGGGMEKGNVQLMQLIHAHGVQDRVILLGPREDAPDCMNALDAHVLPSLAEGFPNVLAEAMACGIPCVTTDVGDAALIARDAAWVVPPRNADALAAAIGDALAMRGSAALQVRVTAGRQSVSSRFGLQTMVDAYDQAWRGLASGRQAAKAAARPDAGGHRSRRLLFVVNNPAFFLSHRLPLAQAARQAGYEVHVATPSASSVADVTAHGFTHHAVAMSRSGKNPWQELGTLHALWRLFRKLRPDIVHAVTIKPVLYGGIAARLARVPGFVAAVSGLGFVFMREDTAGRLVRKVAVRLYRLALGHPNSRVIFQNTSDCDTLRNAGAVRSAQVVMIRGSGVDLDAYRPAPEPQDGAPVVVMASRLLADKGVREFVQAARLSREYPCGTRWLLAGSPDDGNPASIEAPELKQWQAEGAVELLGEQGDIAALYAQANIVALPSYREGLPKGLIEAAACARAVVTTDVPGCRDAIEPDVTGLLVPVRDAKALAEAVQRLVKDEALRHRMGRAGRQLAESAFDIRQVVRRHLEVYAALTGAGAQASEG